MQKAALPKNEKERLEELLKFDILDTDPEKEFDEIIELASQICKKPISLMSLIDADRQWFKSKKGLEAEQTGRTEAFCSHAILQDDVFVINDATKDERFSDNPLVTGGPEVKFYAGMPLKTQRGNNLGTLCVIDDKPGELSEEQKFSLKVLSKQIISQLELRMANEELNDTLSEMKTVSKKIADQHTKITESINYAKKIQSAILPLDSTIKASLPESFVLYQPKDIVSGDFYYFIEQNNKKIIAAVDCTGHGVPGAFMSVIAFDLMKEVIEIENLIEPDEILNSLHKKLVAYLKQENEKSTDGFDISLCVIDKNDKKLSFAGANNPLLICKDGETEPQIIKGNKFSIGGHKFNKDRIFDKHIIDLDDAMSFYIFSDGYQDQFGGPENRKFGRKRFYQALKEGAELNMTAQKEKLEKSKREWQGAQKQIDDVTLIGFRL